MILADRITTKSTRTVKRKSEKSGSGKISCIVADFSAEDLPWRIVIVTEVADSSETVSFAYELRVLTLN